MVGNGDRDAVERGFAESVLAMRPAAVGGSGGGLAGPVRPGSALTGEQCLRLFDAQLASRHLDTAARWLREQEAGFYTIGSSGHEGNAGVAAALRGNDPALLHYRSGAFYLTRAARAEPPRDGVRDVLLGLVAAAAEPISGGRHKVFGSTALHIIPQTSTIASHLPRAVGLAFTLGRAKRLALRTRWPDDAVVVTSLGDASLNHSTALGALNTASHCVHQRLPVPLLIVCEDNGLGISVRTPAGWVAAVGQSRPGIRYFHADGADLADVYDTALEAARWARERRAPAFLHLSMVRFGGHAGSDAEAAYRDAREIAADLARDPLVGTARLLVETGVLTPEQVLARYEASREQILALAAEVAGAPRLDSAAQVMSPIAPHRPLAVAEAAARQATAERREELFRGRLPEDAGPLTLAQQINATLADALAARPRMCVFGEDVARKGGVYGVTRGLLSRFGAGRVFDTVLDEQSILGLALGASVAGLLPVPEIQYLAYLHNAADQIRGEAATLSFFSQAQFRNPLVVRIAGYAYQKGFGGHFHNDNAVAALRDIPGLIIASPSRPDDVAPMLRTCLAAAEADGRVSVFLEPIALYHERDLHTEGDGGWQAPYLPPEQWAGAHVPLGRARTHGLGTDLTIITFGNGLRLSLRAAARLAHAGVDCRVVDLRWLAPLPVEDILREANATSRVLVVDETRRSGGVSEAVVAALVDGRFGGRIARVTSEDSFIPLGDAAETVLLSQQAIEDAAHALMRREMILSRLRTPAEPPTAARPPAGPSARPPAGPPAGPSAGPSAEEPAAPPAGKPAAPPAGPSAGKPAGAPPLTRRPAPERPVAPGSLPGRAPAPGQRPVPGPRPVPEPWPEPLPDRRPAAGREPLPDLPPDLRGADPEPPPERRAAPGPPVRRLPVQRAAAELPPQGPATVQLSAVDIMAVGLPDGPAARNGQADPDRDGNPRPDHGGEPGPGEAGSDRHRIAPSDASGWFSRTLAAD